RAHTGAALDERREPREREVDRAPLGLTARVERDQPRLAPLLALEAVGLEVRAALEPVRLEPVLAAQDLRHPRRVRDAAIAHAVGLLGPDRLRGGRVELRLVVLDEIDLLADARQVAYREGGPPVGRDGDVGAGEVVDAAEDGRVDIDER